MVDWVMRNEPDCSRMRWPPGPPCCRSASAPSGRGSRVHDAGIPTVTQVYDSTGARRAVDAGVDILVARGSEGGGHGENKLGLLPLLDAVLDAVSVPVLAAGGVASARSLAAVLAAGASGAWVGTAIVGVSGGADRRHRPSGPGHGHRNRHRRHPGLRRRPKDCPGRRGSRRGCWPTTSSSTGRVTRRRLRRGGGLRRTRRGDRHRRAPGSRPWMRAKASG